MRRILCLAIAAALLGSCRPRESAAPETRVVPSPAPAPDRDGDVASRTPRSSGGRAPVIWLGFDGLDFELVDRLAAEGRMPNWKRLAAEGYTAKLRSFQPVLSPVVWTTIATGVGPDLHRVLDFQEVDPASGRKVPISGFSRAVPAVWNVAAASGRSVGVVGWWATHPAEEVSGFFISDHASPILFEGLPRAGVAYPATLAPGVDQVAAREGVVSDAEIARFVDVPLEEIARSRGAGLSNPVAALSRILGATRVEQWIARDLYDRSLPDLMAVYFEGTDVIGHVFAPFVPPKTACVSDADFTRYHRAVDEYYAMIDGILGQWIRRAAEDGATLVVNSDHGFKWSSDRPCEESSLAVSMSGIWHRLDGVFAAWGARVRKNPERGTASVFDLAPTVSSLLDLPVDRRVSGRVLSEAFAPLANPRREDLFGRVAVRRVQAENLSPKDVSEYARRLQSLGYLSGSEPEKLAPTGGERPGLTEVAWNNLGVYLRDNTKDRAGAEAAFRKAIELAPKYATPLFNLAVLDRMRGEDRAAIDWLFRSFAAGHAEPESTVLAWYVEYQDRGKAGLAKDLLERGARAYPGNEPIARELGLSRYRAKDCPAAWDAVARFEPSTREPDTLNTLGLIQTCLGRRTEAAALFRRSLAIRPDQPGAVEALRVLEKGAPPARGESAP
ncbi:MAG TPA: alkaline phosphatase family protein [Thermoanaerobaculia bacterium]|nr:alkaline phosphatase family protein [Thermoanaerobaculia bacterium]